jgi:DNA polymerase-3 subunit delta'
MANDSEIYSWQENHWQSLWLRLQKNCLPHALLFSGIAGIGKNQFAQNFARSVLCDSPGANGYACNTCRSCALIRAQSHPDFLHIIPEEKSTVIKIDQVRQVTHFVSETAMLNGYRVIIISPATALNTNGANALLKTLEEPTAKILLILVCEEISRLPLTIVSRCQNIIFGKPSAAVALAWLQKNIKVNLDQPSVDMKLLLNLAQGAPFQVMQFLENDHALLRIRQEFYGALCQLAQNNPNPLQLGPEWVEKKLLNILLFLLSWLRDLICYALTNDPSELINYDYQPHLQKLMQKIPQPKLLAYFQSVQTAYGMILKGANINRQLVLENLLIEWAQICI